ncbi:hypothetical protein EI94DRAFT_721553 [Lactarius quietus]|nr:hypothetical protein EI94DRAFT_721553 [Lactarius quietus]
MAHLITYTCEGIDNQEIVERKKFYQGCIQVHGTLFMVSCSHFQDKWACLHSELTVSLNFRLTVSRVGSPGTTRDSCFITDMSEFTGGYRVYQKEATKEGKDYFRGRRGSGCGKCAIVRDSSNAQGSRTSRCLIKRPQCTPGGRSLISSIAAMPRAGQILTSAAHRDPILPPQTAPAHPWRRRVRRASITSLSRSAGTSD